MLASAATTAAVLARFVFVVRDRDRARQDLIHVASHDPLTGLANRRLFMERLDQCVPTPGSPGGADLHRPRRSEGGERSSRPRRRRPRVDRSRPPPRRAHHRRSSSSARLGGDEFAIVCDDLTDDFSPQDLADRLLVSLREDPLRLADGTKLGITASVGVVTFAGGIANAEAFIKHADDAMYEAKRAGGDRLTARVWEREPSPSPRVTRRPLPPSHRSVGVYRCRHRKRNGMQSRSTVRGLIEENRAVADEVRQCFVGLRSGARRTRSRRARLVVLGRSDASFASVSTRFNTARGPLPNGAAIRPTSATIARCATCKCCHSETTSRSVTTEFVRDDGIFLGRQTQVWVRIDRQWRIAHVHVSTVDASTCTTTGQPVEN